MNAVLASMDRRARIARLRETALGEHPAGPVQAGPVAASPVAASPDRPPIQALLLTDAVSLRYLTGFTGTAGKLLIDRERALFLTDGRYRTQLANQLEQAQVTDLVEAHIADPSGQQKALLNWLKEGLANCSDSSSADSSSATGSTYGLGLEADTLAWADALALQKSLQKNQVSAIQAVPTGAVIATLRARKDEGEVARITTAAAIADQALAEVLPQLTHEPTELEFARALDHKMLTSGAEALSFETICASGPNSALPHARPSDRRITKGDLVVLDFGAQYDGYHSDMTRTFCIGQPSAAQAEMLSTVAQAQQAGVECVRAGVSGKEIDSACRQVIVAAQMGDEFVHGTGHGVGLQIHESPWIGSASQTPLEAGNVVTVEPGVYRPGVGGVRVEDTVLVTDSGAQRLTTAPKNPIL